MPKNLRWIEDAEARQVREFAAMHRAATETFPTVVTARQLGRLRRLAARFFSRGHARGSCDATFPYSDAIHRIVGWAHGKPLVAR